MQMRISSWIEPGHIPGVIERLESRVALSLSFVPTGQELVDSSIGLRETPVALGDIDADGDVDIFVAARAANSVLFNDGSGNFADSGQRLGDAHSTAVALADLDNDGDLDAFVTSLGVTSGGKVWLNDGNGIFFDSGQLISDADPDRAPSALDVALGDFDQDGDTDALVLDGVLFAEPKLWTNDGLGTFTFLGDISTRANRRHADGILVGDVDNDGDLDVLTQVHSPLAYRVWLNDGKGVFEEHKEPVIGSIGLYSADAALGDLDHDGDLDIVGVCGCELENHDRVWLNDGHGNFTDSGQDLGDGSGTDIELGDLDGDGDLDALIASRFADSDAPVIARLNDGTGRFHESIEVEDTAGGGYVRLGDLDGDSDLDSLIGIWRSGILVLLNQVERNPTMPGDANRDFQFDQKDIVQVLQAAKYLSGQSASFEEGDWNHDGVFGQLDIIAAIQTGMYLNGAYSSRTVGAAFGAFET